MHLRNAVLFALVPALALASRTPKDKTKKPPAKKAVPAKDTPKAPRGERHPADKDDDAPVATKTDQSGSGGGGGGGGSGATNGGGAGSDSEPAQPDKKAGNEPDVDALRQEYLSLRDELFKSRARANAVASQLYSTRIQIKLTYTTARYYNPTKSSIRLDGANVYENASGAIGGDDGVRFDGYIAPGPPPDHVPVKATAGQSNVELETSGRPLRDPERGGVTQRDETVKPHTVVAANRTRCVVVDIRAVKPESSAFWSGCGRARSCR